VKSDRPVILVTGANGFVGGHVTPVLEANGWNVRRAVRAATMVGNEIIVGSIGPDTDWREALDGVDIVIHLAARVHHQNEEYAVDLYRDVNIDGTLNLARAAANAGVHQFVFISTVLVHGRSNNGRAPFSEQDILTPRGVYGMSKAEAEAGLEAISKDSAMRVTVIRPPLVYGLKAKGHFAQLATAVKRGVPLPFAGIRNRRAFLSVENLASFIQHRLLKAESNFEVFLVADHEQVSTPEFVNRLARAAGTRSRLFSLPTPILSGLLTLIGRHEANHSLIGSLELDLSKLASTGWQPRVTLDEGLKLAFSHHDP
jgi:UDP-glucose 4-epimerase